VADGVEVRRARLPSPVLGRGHDVGQPAGGGGRGRARRAGVDGVRGRRRGPPRRSRRRDRAPARAGLDR
jgi:hypothetical protein